jgi:TolB protein
MGRLVTALLGGLLLAAIAVASSAPAQPDADGNLIAFSRCRLPDSCDAGADIWVIRPDASGLTRLTRDGTHNDSPSWSPDGRRIAFVSGLGRFDTIWTMKANGTGMRRVTSPRGLDEQPTWSPDGRAIAFVRLLSPTNRGIYVIDADGRHSRALTHRDGDYQHPSWSPNGRLICFAFARNPNRDRYAIYVIDAKVGGSARKLSRDAGGDYRDPVWSPDGKRIAYSYLVPAGKAYAAHLATMDAGGGHERIVLRAPPNTVYFSPSWSPDGRRIAFVTLTNKLRQGRLSFVNADGTRLRRLVQILGDNRAPAWQARPRE